MKFLKIGKRILIGVTILATGLFVAYRIGTYHQNIIEYNNVLVKDIVKSELEAMGKIDQVGGIEYLAELPEKVPTTANASKYINIVHEKSILRNLIKTQKFHSSFILCICFLFLLFNFNTKFFKFFCYRRTSCC